MKDRRLIVLCLIVLFTIQVVPISISNNDLPEKDSGQVNSQGIESSANIVPPKILKYLSPPNEVWGIEYDIIREFSHIHAFIFDPLVEYSFGSGELIPALAKQWVVTNDSKHWIFTLRDDVLFHDGTKFNASAVKFTYDRFIDPTHPAYVAEPFIDLSQMPLESVDILDEYKVSINFYQPYAPFIYQEVTFCGIFSPNSFEGGPYIIEPIGTGPYYLDVAASNSSFQKFIRYDQHFRGLAPFEEIDYIKYSDLNDYYNALSEQEGHLTTSAVDWFPDDWKSYWEESLSNVDGIQYGYFNYLRPIMADPKVRLAINYAVDKQKLVDQMFGTQNEAAKPLRSVIYSGDPYHDDSIQGYPYNILLANALLDSAGYYRDVDGYRFDIKLVGFGWNNEKVDAIRDDLDKIGIRCNAFAGTLQDLKEGFFDLFVLGWVPLTDPSVSKRLLHSSGDINFGGYSNSEIDLYTTRGQETPVRQEREYNYYQVQKIAQEDVPLLLLLEYKGSYLRARNVTPFVEMNKIGRLIFNYMPQIEEPDIYEMEDVDVSSKPIYFPFTDGLVTLKNQQIEGNMIMTHELSNLIPDRQETGKFYEFQVNNSDLEYQIRCYYDLDEILSSSRNKEQEVFQWNYSTQSWDKLEIINSNTNLRFSEIQLKGDALLRLGQFGLILLTYKYFPIILIIIGPIIAVSSFIIMKNRKLMKKIKEEYDI